MKTSISPPHLLSRQFGTIEHMYTHRDTQLYALGVGMGFDPLDADQLNYVYEGVQGDCLRTMPTMANVLAYPGFWAREPDTGIDWRRVVHAGQAIELHAPLPASGRVQGINKVSGLWDLGEKKGALLQQRRQILDAVSGQPLATVTQLNLLRGDGGFGAGATEGAPPPPARHADPRSRCGMRAGLAAAGRPDLSPERRPQPLACRAGCRAGSRLRKAHPARHGHHGHRRPCGTLLGYDASRIAGMRVRFTAPALPGDTLRTDMLKHGDTISLRTTAVERGAVVLDNACVTLNQC